MDVISASILSCDHAYLGDGIRKAVAAGAGSIHVDVMDGYYVENMTFGPRLIWDIRRIVQVPVCVHLEVENPDRIVPLFLDTPCDSIVFQMDACHNPIHLLKKIRQGGKRAGAAVSPAYTPEALRYILCHMDEIILMSVEPGYAGQDFEPSVYGKLRDLRRLMKDADRQIPIGIDGGVCVENAAKLRNAGADTLICGSSLFNGEDISGNLRRLLASLSV